MTNETESRGPRTCRGCGCTQDDCTGCIARTGGPCWWIEPDLCSSCAPDPIAAVRTLARAMALDVTESMNLPGAIVILLGREGHLHAGVAAADHPITTPLLELGGAIHDAVERITGKPNLGDRPRAPRPRPTDRAACIHCQADVAPVDDEAAIRAHLMTCDKSPIVAELAKARSERDLYRELHQSAEAAFAKVANELDTMRAAGGAP